jgi:hypothetical protein
LISAGTQLQTHKLGAVLGYEPFFFHTPFLGSNVIDFGKESKTEDVVVFLTKEQK